MIEKMTPNHARDIILWEYEGQYSIYSHKGDEALYDQLLTQDYYVYLEKGSAIGIVCYGWAAQIPTEEQDVYSCDFIDIGLGLAPHLCSLGKGKAFVREIISYGEKIWQDRGFRLTVACFNTRAIRLYEGLGFEKTQVVHHKISKMPFHIMVLSAQDV